jgi:hypothetical protein
MILKNLDGKHGVCNGSRGILRRYRNRVLEVELLTGDHAREVFIPQISNEPTEDEIGFKFIRREFPVRLCYNQQVTGTVSEGCGVRSKVTCVYTWAVLCWDL